MKKNYCVSVDITMAKNIYVDAENAPKYMQEIDFPYASIADAKRAISGETMVYVDGDMYECRRDDYLNRFKK